MAFGTITNITKILWGVSHRRQGPVESLHLLASQVLFPVDGLGFLLALDLRFFGELLIFS